MLYDLFDDTSMLVVKYNWFLKGSAFSEFLRTKDKEQQRNSDTE